MKAALITGPKYTTLDTAAPLLWALAGSRLGLELTVYFTRDKKSTFLGDAFHAEMLEKWASGMVECAHWAKPSGGGPAGLLRESLGKLSPDIVFLDDRLIPAQSDFFLGASRYCQEARRLMAVLPHSPVQPKPEFFAYTALRGTPHVFLSTTARQLMPPQAAPGLRLKLMGSPAFDSAWLEHLSQGREKTSGRTNCLYLIRKVSPDSRGKKRAWEDISYQDFLTQTRVMFGDSGFHDRLHIVVKPYPSMDGGFMRELMGGLGLSSWEIRNEAVYSLLPEIDFVVGEWTSALFIPYMAGLPCVMMGFSLERSLRRSAPKAVRVLGPAWYYHLSDAQDAKLALENIVAPGGGVTNAALQKSGSGVAFLRKFWPDGAAQRYLAEIEALLNSL